MHFGLDRLTVAQAVGSALDAAGIPFALIGAAASALHGVTRSTADLDLLAVDRACLTPEPWVGLRERNVAVEIRRGDGSDPLAGVVRFWSDEAAPVDLVVGKFAWQKEILRRATLSPYYGIPAAGASDLILLKLYAEGPGDAWDIRQLLSVGDRTELIAQVEMRLPALPSSASALWRKILAE